jgi:hypothetical protein
MGSRRLGLRIDAMRKVRAHFAVLLLVPAAVAGAVEEPPAAPPDQLAAYRWEAPKTVLELQQFRTTQRSVAIDSSDRRWLATLVNLNPQINSWFLLTLELGKGHETYHLENPRPRTQQLALSDKNPSGLEISADDHTEQCDLWGASPAMGLRIAQHLPGAYEPLCGGRLYLRNQVAGTYTKLERATDLLRDHVPGGDRIVGFVKRELYQDKFRQEEPLVNASGANQPAASGGPLGPAIGVDYQGRGIPPEHLGIELEKPAGPMELGHWYGAKGVAGVFVSAFEPAAVSPELPESSGDVIHTLGQTEARALVYLVAFDLAAFELAFSVGTEHPRVGWSERIQKDVRSPLPGPGPDGIDTVAPLTRTGMVSPALTAQTAAAFTGGFKRVHGAFHSGPLAHQNHGSHYGFIEQGVVLSKLVPGLATLFVLDDGSVEMKTWSRDDDRLLARIRYARQNGVPLLERDAVTGAAVPGALVADWGGGNWSGSAENAELRTLRAGVCLQQSQEHRFLLYGYFSDATPLAMARVFQAYRCSYAMHLDMNALEHTYLALYERREGKVTVQHLIDEMGAVDKKGRGREGSFLPRFLGFPDDRDFFYFIRR